MKTLQRTAISLAAAQAALLCSGMALAQTAPAPAASAADAKTQKIETVVVSGRRAALQSAQKIKQDSDEIVDSIVADDIGKLPDKSVTEVLQRIVGVTIERTMARNDPEHYSVEGSGVNIRGLSYVRSEMNGRDTFSANGGRALNFEDVPPELMSAVDVYKNPSAEQIEGAIGGLVNLRTALPFDYNGFKGSVTVQESYSELNGKKKPSASGLLANSWDTDLGKFGALINLASSKSATRSDFFQVEPYYPRTDAVAGQPAGSYLWVPKGAQWRTLDFQRKRDGLYGALQWKKDTLDSSFTYFQSKYHMQWDEQAIFAQTEPYKIRVTNGQFNDQGALVYGTLTNADGSLLNFNDDTRSANRDSKTEDFAWRLNWKPNNRWSFTSDLQYVKASTSSLDSTVATGVGMQKETLDLRGSTPNLIFDSADRAYLADPKNYYWAFTMEHLDHGKATQKSWKGDARYRFEDSSVLQDLRFGLRFTDRQAQTATTGYHWQAISQPWTAGGPAYLDQYGGGTHLNTFNNFFNGSVPTPPAVVFPDVALAAGFPGSYAVLHKYGADNCVAKLSAAGQSTDPCSQWPFAFTPSLLTGDIAQDIQNGNGNSQSEKTQAGFAQLRFGFDDWKLPVEGNIGVRVVHTQNKALGYTSFNGTDQAKLGLGGVPVANIPAYKKLETFSNSYTDVLPSLNLKMQASRELQFRFAAAKAIARPDFDKLQAYTQLNQDVSTTGTVVNSVSQSGSANGNPMLKPTRSTQQDATAEWYFSRAGSLTFAAFHKKLEDVIINQTTSFQLPDASGKPQSFSVTSPVNGARGSLTGVELAFQTYFDKLPGWLSGFGVQANYTYVDSKTSLYSPVDSAYCNGSSNNAANIALNLNGCDTDGRQFGNLPLQGLSRKAYNLTLMYDQGPLSARLAYSWRSRYLQAVNVNGTQGTDGLVTDPSNPNKGQTNVAWGLPVWAESYGQLDAGVSYKFYNDHLALGLEAQNLNAARQRQLMQQHVGYMTRGLFYTGPRYAVTARYTF